MDREKQKSLETAGFRVGDAADFLELTDEERMLVSIRLKVARLARSLREQANLTQKQVASRIKSTQPRVAKIEAASHDVSLDQMLRGFFAVGGNMADLTLDAPKAKRAPRSPTFAQNSLPEVIADPANGDKKRRRPAGKRKKPGNPIGV
jgi:transcriptional regulator with XRE-family HTH domain